MLPLLQECFARTSEAGRGRERHSNARNRFEGQKNFRNSR